MSSIKLSPNASGTGIFTVAAPATNTDRTLTLPDNTGTLLSSASTVAVAQLPSQFSVNASAPSSSFAMEANGRVTMPNQPYYVGVDRASTYSGTGTVWVHSTTRVNTGNCMNTSTGVFTCPIAGRYLVMFHVLTRSNAAHNVAIQKNGTAWVAGRDIATSGEQCTGAWSVVDCAANDQLRIFVDCDAGGDFWVTYNATTIMLIS